MSGDNPWYGDINPVCNHITDQYVFEANNRKKTWYLLEHQVNKIINFFVYYQLIIKIKY